METPLHSVKHHFHLVLVLPTTLPVRQCHFPDEQSPRMLALPFWLPCSLAPLDCQRQLKEYVLYRNFSLARVTRRCCHRHCHLQELLVVDIACASLDTAIYYVVCVVSSNGLIVVVDVNPTVKQWTLCCSKRLISCVPTTQSLLISQWRRDLAVYNNESMKRQHFFVCSFTQDGEEAWICCVKNENGATHFMFVCVQELLVVWV
mmetsp:Transcript_6652/g.12162  ORF Transcript_6652/g.12162 Transcript_6652/m.12162 type:complete len:204 (-) Transcript_6652:113-724(-)